VAEPAHPSAKAGPRLPAVAGARERAGLPVCRDPNHAAPCLGKPTRWRVSFCDEPAFEPRALFCRCLCAQELAGRTHACHSHGLAAGEAQRAGVPHRVSRVMTFPGRAGPRALACQCRSGLSWIGQSTPQSSGPRQGARRAGACANAGWCSPRHRAGNLDAAPC
jgi:hypothetical protein